MTDVVVGAGVALLFLVAFVVLASHLGERTWSDEEYERKRRAGTSLGNAALAMQAVFEPGAQHVLEQRTDEEADDSESGAPPDPSEPRRP